MNKLQHLFNYFFLLFMKKKIKNWDIYSFINCLEMNSSYVKG